MTDQPIIRKLDEAVINRIAAGEVIQRPANALKELIENSLDAKSTNIQITVKNGGMKLLQVQDNGVGVRRDDFEIVCERFTTSKLRNFDDLQSISTYGFRGEALASISHIAHLTIHSKTSTEICAYKLPNQLSIKSLITNDSNRRAIYIDGRLQGSPTPIAGNQGTTIIVEDLFYNMNVRRNALRSPAEEYQKITEVVGKYAIHNSHVSFLLKKSGESNDIKTVSNSNCVENIRTIYGNLIARELTEISVENGNLKFTTRGYISNVNYSTKKFNFLLFINHRLVDCQNLKKCIDQVYSTYLPKNTHPFVYLSLELEPTTLDVNVHPTKHEVHFLNEEPIIDAICKAIETKLLESNNSRKFYTQAKLPGFDPAPTTNPSLRIYSKDLVRTDFNEQKLEKFFGPAESNTRKLCKAIKKRINRIETQLTSVLELRKSIEQNCHRTLRDLFAQHVFVGCINPRQSLIQYSTKLFLCNTKKILYELFYQLIVYNFQNFDKIVFDEPLSVRELALIGLEQPETGWTPDDGDKADLAGKIAQLLTNKSEMLNDYFSVEIDTDGNLISIPLLLDNYLPDYRNLPLFLIRLSTEVSWDSEKECFDTFAKEIALFYCDLQENFGDSDGNNDWKWLVEHTIYPAIKEYFIPPKRFIDDLVVLEIADLPNLYKVFERC